MTKVALYLYLFILVILNLLASKKKIRSFIRIKLGRGKLMYISCYSHSHPINLLTKIDQISNQN